MQVVFRMSAIVAALAISAGTLLAACGQRGPLYMPVAPPMPVRPSSLPPLPASVPAEASSASSAVSTEDVPDTSGTALSLSPDDNLKSSPSASAPKAASSGE
ncbi:lipoprotein [Caballeronia sp. LjRoot31]|nr:lipoprotein [Caballeronia sp. dw_19]